MRAPASAFALALFLIAGPSFGESPLEGKVTVRCPVVGATVYVDDQPMGVVPLAPFDLRFGSHVVSVKKDGLISFEKQIRLSTGQHLVIDAIPSPARSLLTIEAGLSGGEVELDGKSLGVLPIERRSIAPGRHTLVIRTAGHDPAQMSFVAPPHEEYVARPAFVSAVSQVVDEADDDLELELELALAPAPTPAPTPTVPEDDFASLPNLEALTAREVAAVPMTTFVVDPIARDEVAQETAPPTPLYKKGWFWAATGAVAVAAVAIPVLAGSGGYQEIRDPSAACADCLAVLNR